MKAIKSTLACIGFSIVFVFGMAGNKSADAILDRIFAISGEFWSALGVMIALIMLMVTMVSKWDRS